MNSTNQGTVRHRSQPEENLQAECIKWFAYQYPVLWRNKRLWAIPNAARRGKHLAAVMKRTGMVAGVSDLMLSVPRGKWAGMFVEIKYGNNDLSEAQEAFIKAHQEEYYCVVCWSVEQFCKSVNEYLNYKP